MTSEERKTYIQNIWMPMMAAQDMPALRDSLTEDAALYLPQTTADGLNLPRPVKGRDAVLDIFNHSAAGFFRCETREWTYHALLSDGEYLSVNATMNARTIADKHYKNDYILLFRFRGEKISEFWEFNDTQTVEQHKMHILNLKKATVK